jgi:hypothetical protein
MSGAVWLNGVHRILAVTGAVVMFRRPEHGAQSIADPFTDLRDR